MAKTDIILSAGIRFNPRDVDTRAIRDTVSRTLSTTKVNINKISFGREARTALETAIRSTVFKIESASFGRGGLTQLRNQFRQNEFRIDKVAFTTKALEGLSRQLRGTQLEIGSIGVAQARGGAGLASAGAEQARGQAGAQRDLATATKTATDRFREQARGLAEIAQNTSPAERSQRNFLATVAGGSVSLQGFGANLAKVTARFSTYLISIKAVLTAQQAFSNSLQVIFDFDAALQDLSKVIDTNRISLQQVAQGLFNVASQTGQAVSAVAESTGQFVRQGLEVPDALERAKAALIGVNAANISVSDSTKLVTVALRVFGDEIGGAVDALDILNVTADNAATNQEQIVQGILRSGAAAKTVGVSFGELNAIIAATVEQTQLSGNQIGSALKTIFARLATNTSGLRDQANALGANIQPGESLVVTLQKIADVFPRLTKDQQAQIVALAAGKRRFTEFSAILQQLQKDETGLSRVQQLLNLQLNATGNTAAKNEAELQKLSTRAQQVANAFSEFIAALTETGGAGGGITNFIGNVLDVLTDVGKALTDGVRFAQGFGNEFVSLFSVIKNLGQAAFFVIGPTVVREIIAGFKAFTSAGVGAAQNVKQILDTQTLINQQIKESVNLANSETRALSEGTKQLEARLRLRNALSGALGNQAQAEQVAGQNLLRNIEAQGKSGIDGINKTSGKISNILNRTVGNLDSFAGRIVATTIALQALESVSTVANDFANTLENSGNKTEAELVKVGNSALQTGGQIALLAGPVAGLVAGLGSAAVNLTKLAGETFNQRAEADRAVNSLAKMNVALGQVEKTGSKELIDAFKELSEQARSSDPSQAAQALVSANTLVARALQLLSGETSSLNESFRRSGEVLENVTLEVANALRASKIQQEIGKLVSGFQQRSTELRQQQAGGPNAGAFTEVAKISAQIDANIAGANARLLDQQELENNILGISKAIELSNKSLQERAELNVATAQELLQSTNAQGSVIEELITKRDALNTAVERELDNLKEQAATSEAGLKFIEGLNKEFGSAAEKAEFFKNIQFEINTLLREAEGNESSIKELQDIAAGSLSNIKSTQSEILKLEKEINSLSEARVKTLDSLKASVLAEVSAIQLGVQELEKQLETQIKSNNTLDLNANKQSQIARLQLNANSLAEQQQVAILRIGAERDKELGKLRELQKAEIEALQTERQRIALFGDDTLLRQVDQAIKATQELQDAQSREIERKFNIELRTELEQDSIRAFQSAERALRDFRLRQIDDILQKEQEASTRRIDFIKQLGESIAGLEFVRNQGLSGLEGDQRDFGAISAAVLKEFEDQSEKTIAAIVSRLDQLRVNGINIFQELNQLKSREADLNQEISSLLTSGANPERLARARTELANVSLSIDQIKERGIDSFKELQETQEALSQAQTIKEENLARRRELALELVESAVDRVNEAEKELIDERNKIPELNARIVQAQRTLASASQKVTEATSNLLSANQRLADANFELAFNIGLAEFKARQAAGGFESIQSSVDSLQSAFENAVRESKGSFETILNARREVLQEEVNLVQGQLQALRSLSQRAFSADPEQLLQLQEATQIAAGVQAGDIKPQDLLELPPELRQALSGLTSQFPALQAAIDEVGAGLLGIDPEIFKSLEEQLVELQVGIAETGQIQVQQAEQQVRTAQQQLEEARSQKQLAQQQLENAIATKEAQLAVASETAANAAATRAGFRDQINATNRILAENRRGAESTTKVEAAISVLNERQNALFNEAQSTARSLEDSLGLTREQTAAIFSTRDEQSNTTARVAENVRATQSVEQRVAEGANAVVAAIGNLNGNLSGLLRSTFVPNRAAGSLTSAEINGLLQSAQREKRAMPAGSRLMLANTSETVLTKRQSRRLGLSARIPNAQAGNAVVDGTAFQDIANQLSRLNARLNEIATRTSKPQLININLESARTIQIDGLNDLQTSLQDIVTQRLGNTPSQEEISVISQAINTIINRLKEQGNEDFGNI